MENGLGPKSCRSSDQVCSKKKSLDSPNSLRIRILRKIFKVKPVISWNEQNSFQRIILSNSQHFTKLEPRGLFLIRYLSEQSRSNIWVIYESTPQPQGMNTVKRDLRFPRFEISQEQFEKKRKRMKTFFPLANLIMLPTSGWAHIWVWAPSFQESLWTYTAMSKPTVWKSGEF